MISYVESKNKNKKQGYRYREQIGGCQSQGLGVKVVKGANFQLQ